MENLVLSELNRVCKDARFCTINSNHNTNLSITVAAAPNTSDSIRIKMFEALTLLKDMKTASKSRTSLMRILKNVRE